MSTASSGAERRMLSDGARVFAAVLPRPDTPARYLCSGMVGLAVVHEDSLL